MLRLYIDGFLADITPATEVSITLSIASLTQTTWGRACYSKSILIPTTPTNRRLMGDCENPRVAYHFNHAPHTARVEWGGSTIIEGAMFLTACRTGRDGYYRFNIIGNAREWVRAAAAPLASMDMGWQGVLDQESVVASWAEGDEESLVRWLPVSREAEGGFVGSESCVGLLPTSYHPFLHLGTLVERIFASAGYRLCSNFFATDEFRRLYVSGLWAERYDAAAVAEESDFVAVRTEDSSPTEADTFGRVFADPLANYSTVGNLVEPFAEGAEGAYNRASESGYGLLTDDYGRLCFAPHRAVAVGFEYRLRYKTDYRILSRERLAGFDTVRPDYGYDPVVVPIANEFSDLRGSVPQAGYDYTLLIFDHSTDVAYRLVGYEPMADGSYQRRTLCDTTSRATTVNTSYQNLVRLQLLSVVGDSEVEANADWALYDGWVKECGTLERDLTILTRPLLVDGSRGQTRLFDTFYFGGAEAGQCLTLLAGTTLVPRFYAAPVTPSDVLEWADVAPEAVSQMELLTALRNLYDLQIYTDAASGRVFVEPRSSFYDPSRVVDWRDRTVLDEGVVVEELGSHTARNLTVCYVDADRAVAEAVEEGSEEPWGEWSARVEHIFASEGQSVVRNALFAASLEVTDAVPSAPSARLVAVGDRGAASANHVVELNFSPKIVAYEGLTPLPEGEQWGWPSEGGAEYPRLSFFEPATYDEQGQVAVEAHSLRMADSQGVPGLGSRFWQGRVDMLNHSRRVRVSLLLWPEEVEQLMAPTSDGCAFGAHFLLRLDGEEVLCRLEEVADYNPSHPIAKCTFMTV